MTYAELIQTYFERSNALQWYWTLYVVIIGGLLAFASLRKTPDRLTTLLVTVLFCFFAYKNLGAIQDVTVQRFAVLDAMKQVTNSMHDESVAIAAKFIVPTLQPPAFEGVRVFHIASAVLTVASLWAMELRRRRAAATP
ncbi:MAG: hypothetical protein JNM86_13725 [Phycisphaerae bacterium]|nr:hypothetical protein [Phycisphaerae bacterium]